MTVTRATNRASPSQGERAHPHYIPADVTALKASLSASAQSNVAPVIDDRPRGVLAAIALVAAGTAGALFVVGEGVAAAAKALLGRSTPTAGLEHREAAKQLLEEAKKHWGEPAEGSGRHLRVVKDEERAPSEVDPQTAAALLSIAIKLERLDAMEAFTQF